MTMDKKYRSFLKAMSWRLLATFTTVSISYFVTGSAKFATSIGALEFLTKIILFYFHERTWLYLRFGKVQSQRLNEVNEKLGK